MMATNIVPPRKTDLLQETNLSSTTRHLVLVVIEHNPCMIKLKTIWLLLKVPCAHPKEFPPCGG